jgi:hypothetical protein
MQSNNMEKSFYESAGFILTFEPVRGQNFFCSWFPGKYVVRLRWISVDCASSCPENGGPISFSARLNHSLDRQRCGRRVLLVSMRSLVWWFPLIESEDATSHILENTLIIITDYVESTASVV